MKRIILSLAAILLLPGCASVNMVKLIRELKNDPSTAYARIPTPYGTFIFIRSNPTTNSAPILIDPEGKISVGYSTR